MLLGAAVGRAPDPPWLFSIEASWTNHSTLVAWWLTWLGYAYVLLPLCVILIVIAVRYPAWRTRAVASIVALLIAWQAADFYQHVFARPRRLDWVVHHEHAFSYPSSHAAIVTAFYLLWALFVARSTLCHRVVLTALLTALALGIMWSRLALGAHYVTDLAGGVLLGATLVALMSAVEIKVLGPPAGRA